MKISVIIPVFNEKDTVLEVLRRVLSAGLPGAGTGREVIIVDDGSTDGTRELLKEVDSRQSTVDGQNKTKQSLTVDRGPWTVDNNNELKVIFHEKNRGKGAAVRTGFRQMTGDIAVIQDADLELDPGEYPSLLKPLMDGSAKVVFGSRFRKKIAGMNPFLLLANRMFTFTANMFFGTRLTDVMTCYKVMKREVLDSFSLESEGFDIEAELTAKICGSGYEITEVPVSYDPRRSGSGKKIRLSDSFPVIGAMVKYRFKGRDGQNKDTLHDRDA